MKKVLKFLLITIVYTVLYMISNALLPFSAAFKAASAGSDGSLLIFFVLSATYTCFVICFITANLAKRSLKSSLWVFFMVFVTQSVMTQIETLFFGGAFGLLTTADTLFIMLTPLLPTLAACFMARRFFGRGEPAPGGTLPNVPRNRMLARLALVGVIYLAIYFVFGYFVAWQSPDLRLFYSGTAGDPGFLGQLAVNYENNPVIFPFQILRGMMFGLCVWPLRFLLGNRKGRFTLSVCLVYMLTAVVLIVPNVLFPDSVRLAHLVEMSTSMLLFGVVSGRLLRLPEGR